MSLSAAERETLKSIFRLSGGEGPVRPGDLVERLSVAPATMTARLKKLAEAGYLDHRPYLGVTLTAEGRVKAVAAIRRHRIVERFLADMLGFSWDRADSLAVSFEHALPADVVQRMYTALDRPATCPHGFPIPGAEAEDVPSLASLAEAEPGDVVEVAIAGDTHPEVVAFLDTMGVRPGAVVTVKERYPFDGPVVVSVEGVERVIGHKVASEVYATLTTEGGGAPQHREDEQSVGR